MATSNEGEESETHKIVRTTYVAEPLPDYDVYSAAIEFIDDTLTAVVER